MAKHNAYLSLRPVCPLCGRQVEYVGLKRCADCLGATVWSAEDGAALVAARLAEAEALAREKIENLPPGMAGLLPVAFEAYSRKEDTAVLSLNYRIATILDILAPLYRGAPDGTADASLAQLPATLQPLLRVGELRQLYHRVRARQEDIVAGVEAVPGLNDSWSEPPFAWFRYDKLWTAWTLANFHRLPVTQEEDRDLALSFTRLDGDALFRIAQNKGIPLGALDALVNKQMLKALAPNLVSAIERMPAMVANGITKVAHELHIWAEEPLHREPPNGKVLGAASIPEERVAAWLGALEHVLLPPITAGHPACVAPLLFAYRGAYWYSPTTVDMISREIQRNALSVSREPLEKQASRAFELLVARLLPDAGFQTRIGEDELVGVTISNRTPAEVDVFAWNDRIVLLVETKAEAEQPGAWSDENTSARRARLTEYARAHAAKVDTWSAFLREGGQPKLADGRRVDLPAAVRGRPLRGVLISARVEPRVIAPEVPIVTYMSRPAIDAAGPHVPAELVCPWWDGTESPVAFD